LNIFSGIIVYVNVTSVYITKSLLEYFEWDNCFCECYISFYLTKSLNVLSGITVYVNVTSVSEMKSLNNLSGIIVFVNATSIFI
jgi:hypothetical protein